MSSIDDGSMDMTLFYMTQGKIFSEQTARICAGDWKFCRRAYLWCCDGVVHELPIRLPTLFLFYCRQHNTVTLSES
jgi:hypothetical protein